MSINNIQEISIKNMQDIDEIKKKVIEKVEGGSEPNDVLIEVFENEYLSRGNKLKIGRYLVLKGADRSLMVNNSLARGSRKSKRKSRKSRKKSRKNKRK